MSAVVFEIPSASQAALGRIACGGAEVPPFQNTEIDSLLVFAHFEDGEEGLLRNIDLADAFHALLAFLLLFQELALTADVSAVAFGDDVLA